MLTSTYIKLLVLTTLLILPSIQNVPENQGVEEEQWAGHDNEAGPVQIDEIFTVEERPPRDLRSLRARYFSKPRSAFPYYKGLGRK
ncbi:unnamed protein product [Caenorhabditis brenneri]